MRSTLFLAALAAGAANAYEKRVYVTDWTTVTVTKTVTAAAVTETITPSQQVQVAETVVTSTQAPAPVAETTSTSSLAKKSTEVVPAAPATTQAAQGGQDDTASAWSTAWTSTFEAAASSTLQPQVQTSSASSTTQAAAASSSSSSTSTSSDPREPSEKYKQAVLYNHNIHRSNHSASSVEWEFELWQSAYTLAQRCVYEHDTSIKNGTIDTYGQNIGYGVAEDQVGEMITNLMYNDEIGFYPLPYGKKSPDMAAFDKWGHFSQIVWKSTTHVACVTNACSSLGNVDSTGGADIPFTVCNYYPAGNYGGEYGTNVLAPGDAATYTA